MNRLEYQKENIVIVGDIHGQYRTLLNYIKRTHITNTLFIQVGDLGAGFHKGGYYITEFLRLNDGLKEHNNVLIAIRGNHDNPEYFNGDWKYSNLKLVPDYTIVNNNILCIGGASSIDREIYSHGVKVRIKDKTWWEGELPVYDSDALKELESYNIEHVIAHTNPIFCYPHDKAATFNLSDFMKEYIKEDRKTLTHIYDYLSNFHTIKTWWNGHYHWNHEETINNTKFITLDIMEFKEL